MQGRSVIKPENLRHPFRTVKSASFDFSQFKIRGICHSSSVEPSISRHLGKSKRREANLNLQTVACFANIFSCLRQPNIALASKNTTAWPKRAFLTRTPASSCSTEKLLICHPLDHFMEASLLF